jgi:hypothetical protein
MVDDTFKALHTTNFFLCHFNSPLRVRISFAIKNALRKFAP